jgi:small subunit ribosomal protein S15
LVRSSFLEHHVFMLQRQSIDSTPTARAPHYSNCSIIDKRTKSISHKHVFFLPQIAQMVQESQRYLPKTTLSESAFDDEMNDIDSPPADDYIVNVGDLDNEDDESAGIEDDGEPPAWVVSQQRLIELRTTYRRHDKDTGSPEYQVAGMTERISYLTKHLQLHPKDFSTRRGLVALVNKRRRLLNYLHGEDEKSYIDIVSALGIRHKAPSNVASREDKYSRYPKQKAIQKHLLKKKN